MTANMSHYITTKTAQHSTTHPPDGAQDGPDDGVADCGGVDEVGAQEAPQVAAYHTTSNQPHHWVRKLGGKQGQQRDI